MNADTLPDIALLLSGSVGANTRAATCTAIAACSAGEEGASLRRIIGTTTAGETVIRRLLILCGDDATARLALSALVNLSEDDEAAATMVRASAVERCTAALLDDEQRGHASLYAGLLSNLTRFATGVDALVGKGKATDASNRSVNTLLRLVARIDNIPNVLWMSNACSTPEGRAALLLRNKKPASRDGDAAGEAKADDGDDASTEGTTTNVREQPLSWLLALLSSKEDATRLAAASALRNCAMAEECHDTLVASTNAMGVCLAALIPSDTALTNDQVLSAPPEVRDVVANPSKARHEGLPEIRLMLVEALLLLCKTSAGRDALLDCDAYYVLDEWAKVEDDDQIKASINSILLRMTALEEEDGATGESTIDITQGAKRIEAPTIQALHGQ